MRPPYPVLDHGLRAVRQRLSPEFWSEVDLIDHDLSDFSCLLRLALRGERDQERVKKLVVGGHGREHVYPQVTLKWEVAKLKILTPGRQACWMSELDQSCSGYM